MLHTVTIAETDEAFARLAHGASMHTYSPCIRHKPEQNFALLGAEARVF